MIKSLRKFLREWLGIKDDPKPSGHAYVRTDDIKESVEDAIREAFLPELSTQQMMHTYWYRDRDKDIRGTLQQCVRKLIDEDAENAVEKRVAELLQPESFIDGVVERIKRKQIISNA